MSEVRASIRRHWPVALLILALIPIVMGVYLAGREVTRPPAVYTTSADVLIPARSESGEAPENVPPVLLQGQPELANSPETKELAFENADINPDDQGDFTLVGRLNEPATVMTLSVDAPTAALSQQVLDGYITAYETGRRDSVRDAALELQDVQRRTIGILDGRIGEVQGELVAAGVGFPPLVPDGDPIAIPAGVSQDNVLLLYERNALYNERQRRQVAYSLESTRVQIPSRFSVVVQRRTTVRVTPPPPSPVVPLLQILGVGLVLAIFVPWVIDRFDRTITEPKAVPGALRSNVLGTFPPIPRRLQRRLAPPGSSWELSFRSLAATAISTDRLPGAILVASPSGNTQDWVSANFAAGLAGLGVQVALVGTVPRQRWFLHDEVDGEDVDVEAEASAAVPAGGVGLPPRPAGRPPTFPDLLREVERGGITGDLRPRLARRAENLFVIPPGDDETELSLDGLPPLLDTLARSGIDVVVVASPEFLADPSSTIIAWSTRHVLWALELGSVAKADAALAVDRLELAGVEPFGIALFKRHAARP